MQLKKKSKLVEQLNEAEILHQNTDRRASQVRSLLGKYLDEPDLREYDTFLVHLIKHITDLKETEQRIKLGEEQLVALNDNLITPPSPSWMKKIYFLFPMIYWMPRAKDKKNCHCNSKWLKMFKKFILVTDSHYCPKNFDEILTKLCYLIKEFWRLKWTFI